MCVGWGGWEGALKEVVLIKHLFSRSRRVNKQSWQLGVSSGLTLAIHKVRIPAGVKQTQHRS